MNLLSKLIFIWKKPKIIIVTGKGRDITAEAIFQVLNQKFSTSAPTIRGYDGSAVAASAGGKIRKITEDNLGFLKQEEILIFETKLEKAKNFSFFVKNSKLPILVVTQVGEIPPDKAFFAGERNETTEIKKLTKILPPFSRLILNFDDETVREITEETNVFALTFGFQEGADFQSTDLRLNKGVNFKINYRGNIVPIWLDSLFGKEQIYSALAAAACGIIFDLNLVEISQALKFYKGLPGRMRLIKGIKRSFILDDSATSSVFSMTEALEILGKTEIEKLVHRSLGEGGRKIAVLGDILGIGKYTIEAHETIGEKVAATSNLLFTIGSRAKFIGEAAKNKGFPEEKIFQFDEINLAVQALKREIKEDDLILIDGSTEMKMSEIVKEIKAVQ